MGNCPTLLDEQICTFESLHFFKSVIVRLHFFALFKSAIKSAIAQSLFRNEQMYENVQKSENFEIALFSHVKKSHRTFSKCAIAQPY